jgi:hypothetical protein
MKGTNNIKEDKPIDYPIDIPPVFSEPFNHGIHLLIERLQQWQELLTSLRTYFENKKNTSIILCNTYMDATKSLTEMCLRSSTISDMNSASDKAETSFVKVKVKMNKFTERFIRLGAKFNLDYSKDGGVVQNLEALQHRGEQLALLEEKRRVYLIDFPITHILQLQELLKEKQGKLNQWINGLAEADILRDKAVLTYHNLVRTTEQFKLNRDMTPLPQEDPLLQWLDYRSLRDSYIAAINNLRFVDILHQEECRVAENSVVHTLQTIIQEYITTSISHNSDIKALFSKHMIIFNHEQEWEYFTSKKDTVVLLPQMALPRRLRFLNDDNPRTLPLAQARLVLHATFPWSLRSKRTTRTYAVTACGYLVKYPKNKIDSESATVLQDPTVKRAFRIRECLIQEGFARSGELTFMIRGMNCCRDMKSGVTDRRMVWTFTGSEVEVRMLLTAMQFQAPAISLYRP